MTVRDLQNKDMWNAPRPTVSDLRNDTLKWFEENNIVIPNNWKKK